MFRSLFVTCSAYVVRVNVVVVIVVDVIVLRFCRYVFVSRNFFASLVIIIAVAVVVVVSHVIHIGVDSVISNTHAGAVVAVVVVGVVVVVVMSRTVGEDFVVIVDTLVSVISFDISFRIALVIDVVLGLKVFAAAIVGGHVSALVEVLFRPWARLLRLVVLMAHVRIFPETRRLWRVRINPRVVVQVPVLVS